MKKIIIKGRDLAQIAIWKQLGEPQDHQEIVLYQLEDGESIPLDTEVIVKLADIEKVFNKAITKAQKDYMKNKISAHSLRHKKIFANNLLTQIKSKFSK